jgi:hypothetical protein
MRIAFIDFEASGLGARSWPVEVGWAFAQGDPCAYLIKPAETWPIEAWDKNAEALHGLSLDRLTLEGLTPDEVCAVLTKALEGCAVYSDAPDWDEYWMMRLFEAAGRKTAVNLQDFTRLMPPLDPAEKQRLVKKADLTSPRRHRAADDARYLQALYRLAMDAE